jgi:hypothetical protein
MRSAILHALASRRMTPRVTIDDALLRFESAAARAGPVRPGLLFVERDRIVRELRAFIDGRLAARLTRLSRGQVLASGRAAAPFDLLVRSRRQGTYAVLFRRMPDDGRRLEVLSRIRLALQNARRPLDGVLLYDFVRGRAKLLLHEPGSDRVNGYLRAS